MKPAATSTPWPLLTTFPLDDGSAPMFNVLSSVSFRPDGLTEAPPIFVAETSVTSDWGTGRHFRPSFLAAGYNDRRIIGFLDQIGLGICKHEGRIGETWNILMRCKGGWKFFAVFSPATSHDHWNIPSSSILLRIRYFNFGMVCY